MQVASSLIANWDTRRALSRAKIGDPVHPVRSFKFRPPRDFKSVAVCKHPWGNWWQFSLQQSTLTTRVMRPTATVLEVTFDHHWVWTLKVIRAELRGVTNTCEVTWQQLRRRVTPLHRNYVHSAIIALFRAESQLAVVPPPHSINYTPWRSNRRQTSCYTSRACLILPCLFIVVANVDWASLTLVSSLGGSGLRSV
jgi:hypothetical protein